jgi:hypothetical protein
MESYNKKDKRKIEKESYIHGSSNIVCAGLNPLTPLTSICRPLSIV